MPQKGRFCGFLAKQKIVELENLEKLQSCINIVGKEISFKKKLLFCMGTWTTEQSEVTSAASLNSWRACYTLLQHSFLHCLVSEH